ncbi:MAG: carbohydrate-binding protein [Verrucomicrobiales bacterium]|nr:carbohydrate-binding protein [Verrucomicrobiales bacterium]
MKKISARAGFCFLLLLLQISAMAGTTGVHTTWLWHLHQPNYWPDRRNYGTDHYENAWDTIQQQNGGRPHPSPEILSTIFGAGDRVAAYQSGPKNTISGLLGYANAGAQVSYSGALIENVQSLAAAGQLGYGAGWNGANQTARGWTTSGGKPRMDLVNFTYHHALAPLLSDETLEMELRIQQRQMDLFWGTSPAGSKGYFPAETCFSERMIPILKKVGINWTVIANTHLARACVDFPVVTGSGGEMCDLPNLADQLNPAQGAGSYRRLTIDRGCAPIQTAPFGFQLHYARYVDPETGAESKIILAPSDQAFGWKDSYSTWDLGLTDFVRDRNNPAKPSLVFCAHDGDNAWSGGSSYYNEWVGNMASQAVSKSYEPTTVEQFLADCPPDVNDVVHVEDGGWVYADGDMGSPMFINWHWPPSYSSGGKNVVDPSLGVSDKADNWRVIIATENRVKTAQQISALTPRIDQVRDPGSFSATPNGVELGWHYYLASLDSGFVYYGCHDDECQRATTAQSNAVRNTSSYLSNLASDTTPPTVFIPQRHPWNPGGTNFGVQYGYQVKVATNSDFWVWTYAYDASGITNVNLYFRNNDTNPPTSDQFKTYAGGALAGAWQSSNMTQRVVAPVTGVTPQFIADYYYAKVSGISNAFVDYYVSATDARGNIYKSPIQHVWVGTGSGGGGGGGGGGSGPVAVSPAPPVAGNSVTVQYTATGRDLASANPVKIHLGWNNWGTILLPDATMTFNSASNWWEYTTTVAANATQLDCVFNNGSGIWDNNGGADWHFAVTPDSNPQPPATPQNLSAVPVATNQINLAWSAASGAGIYFVNRDSLAIATTAGTTFSDTGLAANSSHCYFIIASNSVGASAASVTVCTNTFSNAPVVLPAFVMDGAFDSAGYLLASNGLALYGAVRGTTLYVATWSPGTSGANDHFIFVTDQLLPSASTAAPWAKTGLVAVSGNKPFLASESQNSYISWFVNNAATNWPCAKSATTSGALEGTLDLVAAFGAVPANLYLCAAAYQTANSGALAAQSPAGSGPNLDPNEFFVLPISALKDSWGNGTLDLLDPARGFKILSANSQGTNCALSFAAMPGRAYQVQFASSPGGTWSNLPGGSNFATPPQTVLNFNDAPPADAAQRFYRVKLLP